MIAVMSPLFTNDVVVFYLCLVLSRRKAWSHLKAEIQCMLESCQGYRNLASTGALLDAISGEQTERRSGLCYFFKAEMEEHNWMSLASTRKFEAVLNPLHFINLWMGNSTILQKNQFITDLFKLQLGQDYNSVTLDFGVTCREKCSSLTSLCFL